MLADAYIKEEEEEIKVYLDDNLENSLHLASITSLRCDQCDYIAKHSVGLKRHTDFIHKGIMFICDQCDYIAKTTSNLYSHKKTKHDKKVFKCISCDFTSSFKQYLQKHMKEKHNGMIVYFCSECDFNSKDKSEYDYHKKTIHARAKQTRAKARAPIRAPGSQCHPPTPTCETDGNERTKKSKTQLNGYKNRKPHSTIKPFKCDLCDYTSTRNYNVTIHKQSKHEVQSIDFFCDMCTFSTTKQAYLTRHLEVVHDDSGSKRSYPLFTPSHKLPEHKFFLAPGSHMPHVMIEGHALVMNKFFLNGQNEKCGYFYCAQKHKNKCKVSAKACVVVSNDVANSDTKSVDTTHNPGIDSADVAMDSESNLDEFIDDATTLDIKEEIHEKSVDDDSPINNAKQEINKKILDHSDVAGCLGKTETSVPTSNTDEPEKNAIPKDEENDISKLSLISYQGTHTEMCTKVTQDEVVYKEKPTLKVMKNVKRVINKVNGKKQELICDLCDYKTTFISTFKQHQRVKHENIVYSCDKCDYQVKYEASLKRHIAAVHDGITYDCTLCDFKSSTASHLKIHKENVHEGITHDCEYCGKKFKQKVHLKTHVDGMHKGITYPCTYCSYISRQKAHLSHHIATKHEGNPHKCNICGVIYAHNGQLKFHKLKEHGDNSYKKKFQCTECEFSSNKEIFLTRHIQRRHEPVHGKQKRKSRKKKNAKSVTHKSIEEQQQIKVEENVFVEIFEMKPTIVELEGKLSEDQLME